MHIGKTAAAIIGTTDAAVCEAMRGNDTRFGEKYENTDAVPAKYISAVLYKAVERVDAIWEVEGMIEGSWAKTFLCLSFRNLAVVGDYSLF